MPCKMNKIFIPDYINSSFLQRNLKTMWQKKYSLTTDKTLAIMEREQARGIYDFGHPRGHTLLWAN